MSLIKMLRKKCPTKIKKIFRVLIIDFSDKIKHERFKWNVRKYSKRIKLYKDIEREKRCFIIGNGPSLSVEDLENLRNEDCFATNRIYKLFDKTEWRPKYYCSQDEVLLNQMRGEFEQKIFECDKIFLSGTAINIVKRKYDEKVHFFYLDIGPFENDIPPFSEDVTKQIYEGFTVLYACIQLAVYMGYKKIYLLGVDHNYVKVKNGNFDGKMSYAKGLEVDATKLNSPQLDKSQKAYEVAEKYCREKGILIKNATRGGMLEVFERVDFDEVLNGTVI